MTDDRLQYLIDSYLDKTASAAELAELEQWYEQQQQKPGPFGHQNKTAIDTFQQQVLEAVHQNIARASAPVVPMHRKTAWLRQTAVAAAVVLLICAGVLLSRQSARDQPNATAAHDPLPVTLFADIQNPTGRDSLIRLEDGTQVKLAPNSSMQYERPLTASKRTIYLQGKAFFKVAKDASRPFTVYSQSISTTALGTAFTITAFEAAAAVHVQLHEGKVVIKSTDSTGKRGLPDTYLLAGQELAYNLRTHSFAVRVSDTLHQTLAINHTTPLPAGQRTGMEASFEGEPLANVLQQMEKAYHTKIRYDKKEITDMEFSGNIHQKDSMGYILQRIAMLHQLTITKKPAGYLIRKNQ